jgi:hypothetical protein
MDKVGKQLAAQHFAFDTSWRFAEPPSVDYVAYAPYRIADVPGVLLVWGHDTVSRVEWYDRGLGVDSDLNYVIERNPRSRFAIEARALGKSEVSPDRFKKLTASLTHTLGKATHTDSSHASWALGCTSLRLRDGHIGFEDMNRITAHDIQPVIYDSANSAQIRERLSPGLRGLTRTQLDEKMHGHYGLRVADSRSVQYAPYIFHGITGILSVGFGADSLCSGVTWSSHEPNWLIAHTNDTALPMYHMLRSFEANRVSIEQYNALRHEVGLQPLTSLDSYRWLQYWPLQQMMRYDHGSLVYTERPGYFPPQKGVYLSGAEPTMDITTGH